MKHLKAIISGCLLILIISGCTSHGFNRKIDYDRSESHLLSNDVEKALEAFPTGERDSFIVTMEKTYLNLLMGKPDIEDLLALEKDVDKQIRYKVSTDLKSFFYMQTPDGYYPSEHEIIWMHLLLSWGFSLKKEYESARVEAKKAAILLRGDFGGKGKFDDSYLRLMLGTIWAMCGDWEEAQIDFRRAQKLNIRLWWAKQLGNMNKPPKNFTIIMCGAGPNISWEDIDSIKKVYFKTKGRKTKFYLIDKEKKPYQPYMSPDADYWYKRHLKRKNWISELIDDFQDFGKVEPAEGYRYMRFLPEYSWFHWTDKPYKFPLSLKSNQISKYHKRSYKIKNFMIFKHKDQTVYLGFHADIALHSKNYKM